MDTNHDHSDHKVTCGNCGESWCERCDPAPSAQCHWCNGRGYSHMPLSDTTFYDERTSKQVRNILEKIRLHEHRVRLYYGDTKTGRDWEEVYDVTGTLGRSTGPMKVPILLHNIRSMGGGAILDHCIVRIRFANRKNGGDLYRHPDFHHATGNMS